MMKANSARAISTDTAMSSSGMCPITNHRSPVPSTTAEASPASRPYSRRAARYVISTPQRAKPAGTARTAHSFRPKTASLAAVIQYTSGGFSK